MLLDYKEHRSFSTFNKSKVFLTLTLKYLIYTGFFNFFVTAKKISPHFLKNFLLIWLFQF